MTRTRLSNLQAFLANRCLDIVAAANSGNFTELDASILPAPEDTSLNVFLQGLMQENNYWLDLLRDPRISDDDLIEQLNKRSDQVLYDIRGVESELAGKFDWGMRGADAVLNTLQRACLTFREQQAGLTP